MDQLRRSGRARRRPYRGLAAAIGAMAVLAGCGDGQPVKPSPAAQVAAWDDMVDSVPQDGFTLGDRNAAWTLTIYASMTEPDSGLLFRDVPKLVRRWVATGDLKLQVRTVSHNSLSAVQGDAQMSAAQLMQAAGLQDRFWNVWALVAARHAGFATPGDVRSAIWATPGIDRASIAREASGERIRRAIERADRYAAQIPAFTAPGYTLAEGARPPRLIADGCPSCLVPEIAKVIGHGPSDTLQ
jgi:hypothetical protein